VRTWIKICGITRPADALRAVELGADALGFVFHPRSCRFCAPRLARGIIRDLPTSVATVGVWLDEDVESIEREADEAGVQLVQTYELGVAHDLAHRGRPNIVALNPPPAGWTVRMPRWPAKFLLLDRLRSSQTGVRLWTAGDLAAARRWAPVILAGGLSPQNVATVLQDFRPDGVDVASGVESAPGLKDHQKLAEFIMEVRRWDAKATLDASADSSSPRP
jgi:phosphoribosylanthranilate isomerase